MENIIRDLFAGYPGGQMKKIELLPASGSARKYYRIFSDEHTFIGTYNQQVEENDLFIRFSRHFKSLGLHVPEIYACSEDGCAYIQEDLGDTMLLDLVEQEKENGRLSKKAMDVYRISLMELLRFQFAEGIDYSHCIPRPVFDSRCIRWDLNYFKYCFLRLAGAAFSEEHLENDFERLMTQLCAVRTDTFMFRDFQSRNIMLRDGKVWFIDYQGGRQGALQYDVASLLYDAIVQIPDEQREELLDFYIRELQTYRPTDAVEFRRDYYRFVLVRLLQAMGAFGLRGLFEHKQHFIDSIAPGLQHIAGLFTSGRLENDYPEIAAVVMNLSATSWKTGRKEG